MIFELLEGEHFFGGSLVESLGCVLRGYKGFYHTDYSNYVRTDGAKKGGKLAILGGVVFTATTWLYTSLQDRLSTGPLAKLAPVFTALGPYLASQCFAGLI